MRSLRTIAMDMWQCANSWAPEACLMGNVTAAEVRVLVEHVLEACQGCAICRADDEEGDQNETPGHR